jgi:hypothetical protein
MPCCIPRDDDQIELSIRIHAVRKLKPFASFFQKQMMFTESSGSDTPMTSLSIENARILAFCDFKPAQNTHASTIFPTDRDQRTSNDIMSTSRWSAPSSRRTSINDGEVAWSEPGGTLKWKTTRLGLRRHKSFCPKLKFQLFALMKTFPSCASSTCKMVGELDTVESEDTCTSSIDSSPSYWSRRTIRPLGWVVLDIRDFEHVLPEKTFKVNGGYSIGSEVILTLTCLPAISEVDPNGPSDKYSTEISLDDSAPFPLDPEWIGSAMPLGYGNAVFSLTIRLESANCFHALGIDHRGADGWLSYSLFETVVQTDKFSFSTRNSLNPVEDAFRIRCSLEEIQSYFGINGLLKIYICTPNKGLAGFTTMDLRSLIVGLAENKKTEVLGRYIVEPTHKSIDDSLALKEEPSIEASAFLQLVSCDDGLSDAHCAIRHGHDKDLTKSGVCIDPSELENCPSRQPSTNSMCDNQNFREEKFDTLGSWGVDDEKHVGEKSIIQVGLQDKNFLKSEASVDLEKKQLEWETWRHKQELQWHEKLRYKEDTVMRRLEERAREKEKERDAAVESCRLEYSKLEGKLRKALSDVESREHQQMLQDAARKEEFSRKASELEKKHRAVLEEARHSVNLEVCILTSLLLQNFFLKLSHVSFIETFS